MKMKIKNNKIIFNSYLSGLFEGNGYFWFPIAGDG